MNRQQKIRSRGVGGLRAGQRRDSVDDTRLIKTILVAVSAETPSSGVLDLVSDLGRRLGAMIVAFHVREWAFSGGEWVLGEGVFVEGEEESTRVLVLVDDLRVRVLTEDGELIRELMLDPTRDYQPHGRR